MVDLKTHLQMFYAQSFWITLTSSCLTVIASIELVGVYSLDNVIVISLGEGICDVWAFYFHVALLF